MARSLAYISFRSVQLVFALVVMGIAAYLLSEFKKQTVDPSLGPWNSAGDAFNTGENQSFIQSLLRTSDGSTSSGLPNYSGSSSLSPTLDDSYYSSLSSIAKAQHDTTMSILNNIKRKTRRSLFRRSPKGGKSRTKGSGGSSDSSDDSSSTLRISYKRPVKMLIAVSTLSFITAIVTAILNLLNIPSTATWAIYAYGIFTSVWDLFLAVLWLVAVALSAVFLTQYKGWKADFKQAHLLKTCFALSLISMLTFLITGVLSFVICLRARKKSKTEASAVAPVYEKPQDQEAVAQPPPPQQYYAPPQ